MYPTTTSCACVIYLHIKRFTHLKKSLTYSNLRIHTINFAKNCVWVESKKYFAFGPWLQLPILLLTTSLWLWETHLLFVQKYSINDFKSSLVSLSFHGSLQLNVHNSFFVGSSNLSHLTMALLRVPLLVFNVFLVFLMSQAFFIWVHTILDVSTCLVTLLSLVCDLEPTFSYALIRFFTMFFSFKLSIVLIPRIFTMGLNFQALISKC